MAGVGGAQAYNRRFLRYWSLNVALARKQGWPSIPGFPYTDDEFSRIETIAAGISGGAVVLWMFATVVLFIAIAGIVMVGGFWPLLTFGWPDPSKLSATTFFVGMAVLIGLSLCIGLPLSLTLGGAIADRVDSGPGLTDAPGDAALCHKMRAQFWRFGAVFAGLFLPAALVWTALGIDGPWVRTVLHSVSIGLVLLGALFYNASRRARRS